MTLHSLLSILCTWNWDLFFFLILFFRILFFRYFFSGYFFSWYFLSYILDIQLLHNCKHDVLTILLAACATDTLGSTQGEICFCSEHLYCLIRTFTAYICTHRINGYWRWYQPLSCWAWIYPVFTNSVYPDQLASKEANWSGSALFVITFVSIWICINKLDQVIWLAGNWK